MKFVYMLATALLVFASPDSVSAQCPNGRCPLQRSAPFWVESPVTPPAAVLRSYRSAYADAAAGAEFTVFFSPSDPTLPAEVTPGVYHCLLYNGKPSFRKIGG